MFPPSGPSDISDRPRTDSHPLRVAALYDAASVAVARQLIGDFIRTTGRLKLPAHCFGWCLSDGLADGEIEKARSVLRAADALFVVSPLDAGFAPAFSRLAVEWAAADAGVPRVLLVCRFHPAGAPCSRFSNVLASIAARRSIQFHDLCMQRRDDPFDGVSPVCGG